MPLGADDNMVQLLLFLQGRFPIAELTICNPVERAAPKHIVTNN